MLKIMGKLGTTMYSLYSFEVGMKSESVTDYNNKRAFLIGSAIV